MENEIWKEVINFKGLYKVSDMGRVMKTKTGEIVNPTTLKNGYLRAHLTVGTKTDPLTGGYLIHQLVAKHFIENPKNLKSVQHIDGDRKNNKVSNLKWGRPAPPINDQIKNFVCKDVIEIEKISEDEVWVNIIDFENHFQVSNYGRVYSKFKKELVKPFIKSDFYQIYLSNGTYNSYYKHIHRLVAEYFIENPNNYKIVDHIDGNNKNNIYTNLHWNNVSYAKNRKNYLKRKKDPSKKKKKKNIHIIHTEPEKLEDEKWKEIKGYEGLYEVSNHGRVRNTNNCYLLKPVIVNLYSTVQLRKKNHRKRFRLNRLVAKHFIINDDPENKILVDHIDNNKLNNKVNNLRWVTQSENIHSYNQNHKPEMDKPILQYDIDMTLIKEWKSILEILDNYDFNSSLLYACLNGKYKTAYTYIWNYKDEIKEDALLESDEVFKNVGTFDGKDFSNYEVSNYGKIKSLKYDKYLKCDTSNLYYSIMLYDQKSKKGIRLQVHRIVAFVFVEGRTKVNNIVNHLDENKLNNRASNLEWTTRRLNNKYSFAKKVNQIDPKTNNIIKTFDSVAYAYNFIGNSKNGAINNCCNGKARYDTAFGYKWSWA